MKTLNGTKVRSRLEAQSMQKWEILLNKPVKISNCRFVRSSDTEDFVDDTPKTTNVKMASDKQKKLIARLINETGNQPLEDEDYDNMTGVDASKLIDLYNEEKANKSY